jgi:ribosomal protein S18
VKRSYLRNNKQRKANEKKLAEFLSKGGQLLELDRRAGRVFHDQPAACAILTASLFGHHQSHRESPYAGVSMRTRRVCRWRDSGMVKRWMASALLATEKNFRKIMGYRDLWTLDAILNGSKSVTRRRITGEATRLQRGQDRSDLLLSLDRNSDLNSTGPALSFQESIADAVYRHAPRYLVTTPPRVRPLRRPRSQPTGAAAALYSPLRRRRHPRFDLRPSAAVRRLVGREHRSSHDHCHAHLWP